MTYRPSNGTYALRVAPPEIDTSDIAGLYASVGWGNRQDYSDEQIRSMLAGASFYATVEQDNRLVGFVRALSDGVSVTWIAEILVHPDAQKKGIGRILLESVISRFGQTAIYGEALTAAEGFFAHLGFTPRREQLVACARMPERATPPRLNLVRACLGQLRDSVVFGRPGAGLAEAVIQARS